MIYQCSENSSRFAVINNKGKASFKILNNLIRRVGTTVPKSPVSFDHKHGLIGPLWEAILSNLGTQVVQAPHKHTIYVIKRTKQPAWKEQITKQKYVFYSSSQVWYVLPLMRRIMGVGLNVSENSSVAEVDRESVGGMSWEKLIESFLWKLGVFVAFVRCRAIELFWWMSKCFMKYSQHFHCNNSFKTRRIR